MKHPLSAALLALVITVCVPNTFSKEPPTSAEQLRGALESALRARDTNTVKSLYYLNGLVDKRRELSAEEINEAFMRSLWPSFATNVTKVRLLPLPSNYQLQNDPKEDDGMGNDWWGDNGWRGKWSVPVVGMLDIDPPRKGNEPLLYGITNGIYYLAVPITYLAPGKSLYVHVFHAPPSATYTGSWVYVKSGIEHTVFISDKTNQFRQCWGDYIKSCTIQRTSTNEAHWFHFGVTEDAEKVFESGEITNQVPVSYERKK